MQRKKKKKLIVHKNPLLLRITMPSPRRESIHNSNCGFRHHKRNKKMFSKNEDRNRNNNRGKKPKPHHLAQIIGLLPYPIKNVRECYEWNPRLVCVKSKNGVMELNGLGRTLRWVSRKDRSKLYNFAGNNVNYFKMYFDVDLVFDYRSDELIEDELISNASTKASTEDDIEDELFKLIELIKYPTLQDNEDVDSLKDRINRLIMIKFDNIFYKYRRNRNLFYKFSNEFVTKLQNLGYNETPEFRYTPFGVL